MITAKQQKAIGEICRVLSRKLGSGGKPGPFLVELMKTFPEPTLLQKNIIKETRRAFEKASQLENPRPVLEEILEVLCSWGDTIEETDVLSHLSEIAAWGSYLREVNGTNQHARRKSGRFGEPREEGRNASDTTHQEKSARVAVMISEMIDIKIREHDRKHHFEGDEEAVRAEERRSLVDQSQFQASQVNLAAAINDLFSR